MSYPAKYTKKITLKTPDQFAVCYIWEGIKQQNVCQGDGDKCLTVFEQFQPYLGYNSNNSLELFRQPTGLQRYLPGPVAKHTIGLFWPWIFLVISVIILSFVCFLAWSWFKRKKSHQKDALTARTIFNEVDQTWEIGKISFQKTQVLGNGSRGTWIFEGSFEKSTKCAVKRIQSMNVKLAVREIDFLRSLQHPNLVRYYATEEDESFIYIALELAEFTLSSLIDANKLSFINITKEELCYQSALGLQHLHRLDIVHRDLKPQNILVSFPNKANNQRAVMISDFGISKQIKRTDEYTTGTMCLDGTGGYMPKEVVENVINDIKSEPSKSADIFSLGCVFYYVYSNGKHPFGPPVARESNIVENIICMNLYELCKDDGLPLLIEEEIIMANHLITSMISDIAKNRPPINSILKHPIFWSREQQLNFLLEVSDRFEKEKTNYVFLKILEYGRSEIFKDDWKSMLGDEFEKIEATQKHRSYRHDRMRDLLRWIRNKKHHYGETDERLCKIMGDMPDGFMTFITRLYPKLLPQIYTTMQVLKEEKIFINFYDHESINLNETTTGENQYNLESDKNSEVEFANEELFKFDSSNNMFNGLHIPNKGDIRDDSHPFVPDSDSDLNWRSKSPIKQVIRLTSRGFNWPEVCKRFTSSKQKNGFNDHTSEQE